MNALLCEQFSCWNLGEKWKINTTDEDIRKFKNTLPILNYEQKKRLNYIKDVKNLEWVLKVWPNHFLLQKNNFDELLKSDVTLVMTNRTNIEEHFISWINANYRADTFGLTEFQSTNKNPNKIDYDVVDVSATEIISFFKHFVQQLIYWRTIYEFFKDRVVVLSYDEEIKLYDLQKVGITKETVTNYFAKETHYIPTPFNSVRFTEQQTFSESLDLLNNYKYLVEI